MGHSVSRGKASRDDHLVRDIAYLRDQARKQDKALEVLQKEHDELKNKATAQTKELQKVKQENEKLRDSLKLAANAGRDTRDHHAPMSETAVLSTVKPEPGTATVDGKPEDEAFSDADSDTDSGVNVERAAYLKVGDKVLSLHKGWSYYTATVVQFDTGTLMYTIDWDDGDHTGRVQKYCDVAIDRTPAEDEIGIGTLVLFPQGAYGGTEGNNSGGIRYHQGRITQVYANHGGVKRYDGVHTKGEQDGKWVTFKNYSHEFKGLELKDLRVSPNIYDILNAEAQEDSNEGMETSNAQQSSDDSEFDVFMSYCKLNSNQALAKGEVAQEDMAGRTIEEHKGINNGASDPRWIKQQLVKQGLRVWMDESSSPQELSDMVNIMKKCKVIVACISNEYAHSDRTRMELQFTKKTIKKPILPVVVGGGEWLWQMTVVGLLIAGELYIDFTDSSVANGKMEQLLQALNKHVHLKVNPQNNTPSKSIQQRQTPTVFISYCWTNSYVALHDKQIKQAIGNEFNDPRRIYEDLAKMEISAWLDIHQLTSAAADSAGMFEQIAKGLSSARIVLVCVSDEYSESDNCRMEFQFALKSLKKKVVPIIVGKGNNWVNTIIGMLVNGCDIEAIDMREISQGGYDSTLGEIVKYCSEVNEKSYQTPAKQRTYRAPTIGDKVLCHHFKWAYFPATVVAFDKKTFEYTVDWDDGDSTGRQESYKNVALNSVPREDEIAIGKIVFFPQGGYSGSTGNNTGGVRHHQGRITKVYKNKVGQPLYDGEHAKGEEDGKWITYPGYSKTFVGMKIKDLMIAPNPMDALMACERQAKGL